MNEPRLRFKADDGSEFPEWEEKKIGELGAFIKGAALSKADISESGSPLILYGELYTTYKEVAYNIQRKTQAVVDKKYYSCVGDVIIPTSGESAEEISTATCVMVPDVILGGDLNIFRSDIVDGRIMSYILNHQAKWKIATIAQGKSIVHIQAKQLANICVKYPLSKVEQQKIAEFLSTIDTVIEKQKETVSAWEERKKGVMQKLFSQEVRFKADDGSDFPEWEKKKLEDVVEFLDGQRKPLEAGQRVSGKYPYYGASGIIDYVENYIFDEELILLSEDGANILDRNYRVCFLAKGKYWVNNHAHVLRAMDGNVNGFICEQLESFDYRKYNSGGAQPKLNQATCRSIIMNIPCFAEQQKIADCLVSFDEVIEKQKATLAAWEELKKGLLQQMFV